MVVICHLNTVWRWFIVRSKSSVSHRLTSGTITMSPRFFAKESLKAGSLLRIMLGLEGGYSKKVKGITKKDNQIVVTYTNNDIIFVPDDVKGFAQQVKETYKGQIEGRITISMAYGQVSFIDVHIDF